MQNVRLHDEANHHKLVLHIIWNDVDKKLFTNTKHPWPQGKTYKIHNCDQHIKIYLYNLPFTSTTQLRKLPCASLVSLKGHWIYNHHFTLESFGTGKNMFLNDVEYEIDFQLSYTPQCNERDCKYFPDTIISICFDLINE